MSSASEPTAAEGRNGDLLVRIGGVVFAVGAVATLITFIPMFVGSEPFPPIAYGVSMLMGAGFALAGAGMIRDILAQRRRDRAARNGADTGSPAPGAMG
ncbi:hypothetical protein [Streptomyces sp. ST2-7A]|uniref:hypothetical protein n=1 Tax=Streptomyces sp. ST2-7A TaxID=2907214 RepID=UPI001F267C2D|nr:hypothetical protein [Streptomyces sp. ST2-7A]MCE7079081.1 hypothetical protein [Streptomyces sp. ST2-7A]